MYLYVEKARGLEQVPEELLRQFGEPEPALTLMLTPQRRLARADVTAVIAQINEHGFYLQMPPTPANLPRREDRRD
jgi:uncharacterized protein YcgL (UPF0745 family)